MDPVLRDAVVGSDVAAVQALLHHGADVDARDRHGQTALMLAALHGHDAIVAMLLAAGAALDVTAKYGLSALMLAVVGGHAECACRRGSDTPRDGRPRLRRQDRARPRDRVRDGRSRGGDRAVTPDADASRVLRIDAAFRAGDLAALRAAVEDPASVPNGPLPLAIGSCLEYAIYWSPLSFVRTLLELGADPNPADHIGFPQLIAALSCSRPRPGAWTRPDVIELLGLLLEFGADPNQRGINDYTPLHMAVAERNAAAVPVLLAAGADSTLRTRIDDYETAAELAVRIGCAEIVALLAGRAVGRRGS